MVLVQRAVTMEREAALHVTDPDEDLDVLVAELHDVLTREVEVAGTDRHAVAVEDAELLEVDVDWVRPSARLVPDDPALRLIHLRGEPKAGAVHELAVDLPAAVAALEAERPRDARCEVGDLGQRDRSEDAVVGPGRDARRRHGLGIEAAVVDDPAHGAELEQRVALAGGQDPAGRPAAVDLLEAVLQADPLGAEALRDLREVDDDVCPLRHADPVAERLDRPRQEVAVIGEYEERDPLAQVVGIREEELE